MRLYDWRKEQGWNQQQLAERLGCSQGFVSCIERAVDAQIPGRELMDKIHQLTRGAVTPTDFYYLSPLGQLPLQLDLPTPAPLLDMVA